MSDTLMILASAFLGLVSALLLRPFRRLCVIDGRFSAHLWGVFMLFAVLVGFGTCVRMLMAWYVPNQAHVFGTYTAGIIWFLYFAVFVPIALGDMLKALRGRS